MDHSWVYDDSAVDWGEISELYRKATLGEKSPKDLETVFSNSGLKCFVYANEELVSVGRALADGLDCSYIADVAVHPEFQGKGLGKEITGKLVALSEGHKKIILYANPGTEGLYQRIGFHRMNTAMAIWRNQEQAIKAGSIGEAERGPQPLVVSLLCSLCRQPLKGAWPLGNAGSRAVSRGG